MLKKIESLRKQPKHVRNRYAFLIAFFFTGVIVSIWALSLSARFSKNPIVIEDTSGELSNFSNALGDIKSNFAETFDNTGSQVESYQTQSSSTKEGTSATTKILDSSIIFPSSNNSENVTGNTILIGTTTKATSS